MKTTRSSSFVLSRLRALPLLAIGLSCAVAFVPAPRAAHAQTMTVGVVDEDKLAESYKAYQTAIAAVDTRAQGLDSKIPAREYLNETEGKAFDSIIVLPTLAASQQTQLDGWSKLATTAKPHFWA